MAQDLLDRLIADGALPIKGPCVTDKTMLYGAARTLSPIKGPDKNISEHLFTHYGDAAYSIEALSQKKGSFTRLDNALPFTKEEVSFLLQYRYACTAEDILFRRLRLGFMDKEKTLKVLPRLIQQMERELSWSLKRSQEEDFRVKEAIYSQSGVQSR